MIGTGPRTPLCWLVDEWQWPYATAFAACFLLAFVPVVWSAAGLAAMLIYLQLPIYMVHQLEEHGDDRFRRYVNAQLAGGREALTRPATFAINLLAVWAVMVAAFLLAYYVNPGLGLVAVYLTAANALVHVGVAIGRRAYNPGLGTALGLFVPLSAWAAIEVNETYAVSTGIQLLAIAVAVLGHLTIVAFLAAARR
jgi:hypothetical protein